MITIRYLIAKTSILLFFSVLASKSRSLLITIEVIQNRKNKPSQTNFDSNVAIRTFDHEPSALKNKLFQTIRFMGNVVTLRYPSETNRIQREFLFNNCIQSQEFSSASKPPRQKTNFLKLFGKACCKSSPLQSELANVMGKGWGWGMLSLRAAERGSRLTLESPHISAYNHYRYLAP
jgi:hypothetical protein